MVFAARPQLLLETRLVLEKNAVRPPLVYETHLLLEEIRYRGSNTAN